jgi:Zeta toxin
MSPRQRRQTLPPSLLNSGFSVVQGRIFDECEAFRSPAEVAPVASEYKVLPRRWNSTGHLNALLQSGIDHETSDIKTDLLVKRRFPKKIRSTEEIHQWEDLTQPPQFYGSYGHIRANESLIDYTYHVHYRKERQWLHDSIIEDIFDRNSCNNVPQPALPDSLWLIFTAGPMGAGKRYTVERLMTEGELPLLQFVFVDPHEICTLLPEYSSFYQKHQDPAIVDQLTRKECGYIAETLLHAALQSGKNVVWDTCLRSADWYRNWIPRLRSIYGGAAAPSLHQPLRVGLLQVTASAPVILQRDWQQAAVPGRPSFTLYRDASAVNALLGAATASVEQVKPSVDFFARLNNDSWHQSPQLMQCESKEQNGSTSNADQIVTGNRDLSRACDPSQALWKVFRSTFRQHSLLSRDPHSSNQADLDFQPVDRREANKDRPRGGSSADRLRESLILGAPASQRLKMSMRQRMPFSVLRSTEDNHRANHNLHFGQFAHIRGKYIDYGYHANYTFERQVFQDAIIREYLNSAIVTDQNGEMCTTPTEPWIW